MNNLFEEIINPYVDKEWVDFSNKDSFPKQIFLWRKKLIRNQLREFFKLLDERVGEDELNENDINFIYDLLDKNLIITPYFFVNKKKKCIASLRVITEKEAKIQRKEKYQAHPARSLINEKPLEVFSQSMPKYIQLFNRLNTFFKIKGLVFKATVQGGGISSAIQAVIRAFSQALNVVSSEKRLREIKLKDILKIEILFPIKYKSIFFEYIRKNPKKFPLESEFSQIFDGLEVKSHLKKIYLLSRDTRKAEPKKPGYLKSRKVSQRSKR